MQLYRLYCNRLLLQWLQRNGLTISREDRILPYLFGVIALFDLSWTAARSYIEFAWAILANWLHLILAMIVSILWIRNSLSCPPAHRSLLRLMRRLLTSGVNEVGNFWANGDNFAWDTVYNVRFNDSNKFTISIVITVVISHQGPLSQRCQEHVLNGQ